MQDIPSFLREATNEIRVKVSSKSPYSGKIALVQNSSFEGKGK